MYCYCGRLLSFPRNLMNASDTHRGIAKAFAMWSDVSPFSFREVPADEEADIKIGMSMDFHIRHAIHCYKSYRYNIVDIN